MMMMMMTTTTTLHPRYRYRTEPQPPPSVGSTSIIREILCQPKPSPSSSPARAFRSSSTVSICWKQLAKCKGVSWEGLSWIFRRWKWVSENRVHNNLLVSHDSPRWNRHAGLNHGKAYLPHPKRSNLHRNLCCTRCIGIKIMVVLPEHGRSLRQFTPRVAPRVHRSTVFTQQGGFCCNMLQPSPQSLSALHAM